MSESSNSQGSAGRVSVGHPVDVASGNLYHDFEDFELPGRMPLVLGRRYSDSLLPREGGLLGPGWWSPLEMVLRRTVDGYAMTQEQGDLEAVFEDWDGSIERGEPICNVAACCELQRLGDRFVVRRWDHDSDEVVEYVFAASGDDPQDKHLPEWPLASRQDLEGQGYDVIRDASGRPLEVRQRREGRSLRLLYDMQGRLREVHVRSPLPAADDGQPVRYAERRVVSYGYDKDGRLAWMEDAEGQRCSYTCDEAGRLCREENIGGMEYLFFYDEMGRCIENRGADGYGQVKLEIIETGGSGITLMTDALGQVTTYEWNAGGQVERQTDPLGRTKMTVFDEEGRIVEEVSQGGRSTRTLYDERGDRTEVIDPAGTVTRYEHDELHQLVAVVDPAGQRWERQHDGQRRVRAVVNPLGERLSYSYDQRGDLVGIADSLGNQRRLEWDTLGNLKGASDWRGNWTRYEHDAEGNLTAVIDPLGHRTEAELDRLGRVVQVRLADGSVRRFEWDAYNQPVAYTDEEGNQTLWRYQACGLLTEVTRPGGGRLRFDWSAVPGQLLAVVNERKERWELRYDGAGQLEAEQDFAGRTTRYEHNPDGEVTGIEDALGRRTEVDRDDRGTVTAVRHDDDDGSEVAYAYDERGLLLRADNGVFPVEREYDAVGRLVRERQGEHEVESEYDRAGNRVRRVSSLGHVTRFSWDEDGQLRELAYGEPEEQPRLRDASQAPLSFEYDARQDEVRRGFAHGAGILQAYDERGRRVEQRVERRRSGAPQLEIERRYRYDRASNLLEILDGSWGPTRYTYDVLGRIVGAALPGGVEERFRYDATDNLVATTKPDEEGIPWETGCAYGPGSVLKSMGLVRYEHDRLGQLVRKIDAGQETRYTWNRSGQLMGVELPDGSAWTYGYDAFGRRVYKEGPLGRVEFVWDGDVVLHEIRTGQPGEGDDGGGEEQGAPAPEVVHWEFDPAGFAPICKVEEGEQYLCVNDVAGNPRELVRRDGLPVWRASYSAWGDVTVAEGSRVDCPVRFQGQWADEETGLYYNRFRYFEPALGRYISPDPIGLWGGVNLFGYGGNTTGWIDPYGLTAYCGNALLLKDRAVRKAIRKAVRASRMGKANPREHGGLILRDPNTGKLSVMHLSGTQSTLPFPLHPSGRVGGKDIVGSFHTHPNVGTNPNTGTRWSPFPSSDDVDLVTNHPTSTGPNHLVVASERIYHIDNDGNVSDLGNRRKLLSRFSS